MANNYTFDDLFYETEFNNFVDETNYLVHRRRQQKKRSREWSKYRKAEIAAGRPDPGRNKYTPNRYYSRKRETTTVASVPLQPSGIVLPEYPVISADIITELNKITYIPVNMIEEILNEVNPSGADV